MCNCLSAISGTLAALSLLSSIPASIYFMFYVNNVDASAFALLAGIFSACTLHLNISYIRRTIRDWYTEDQLDKIASFALVSFLLSNVFFGVYLSLGIVWHQGYTLKTFSYYIPATCSAASSIWALALFIWALLYRREQIYYPLLLCRTVSNT